MSIGAKIKELRRKNDITQEQLAEYLGISSPAISQWECEKSAPDISQLPILANIFDVTVDALLEVNTDRKSKIISDICEHAKKAESAGHRADAIDELSNGLRQFPNSYTIMEQLAENLYVSGNFAEALYLAEKVVNNCNEIGTKTLAAGLVISIYDRQGKRAKAIEFALSMPEVDRGHFLALLYKDEELAEFLRKDIWEETTSQLVSMMRLAECTDGKGNHLYSPDERIAIYRKVVVFLETLFEDGDYNFAAQWGQLAYYRMSTIFAAEGDLDNTIDCLVAGTKFGKAFDDYQPDAAHTSLLCRGVISGGWIKSSPSQTYRKVMLDGLKDSKFDFIRNDSRFIALVDSLK